MNYSYHTNPIQTAFYMMGENGENQEMWNWRKGC